MPPLSKWPQSMIKVGRVGREEGWSHLPVWLLWVAHWTLRHWLGFALMNLFGNISSASIWRGIFFPSEVFLLRPVLSFGEDKFSQSWALHSDFSVGLFSLSTLISFRYINIKVDHVACSGKRYEGLSAAHQEPSSHAEWEWLATELEKPPETWTSEDHFQKEARCGKIGSGRLSPMSQGC